MFSGPFFMLLSRVSLRFTAELEESFGHHDWYFQIMDCWKVSCLEGRRLIFLLSEFTCFWVPYNVFCVAVGGGSVRAAI